MEKSRLLKIILMAAVAVIVLGTVVKVGLAAHQVFCTDSDGGRDPLKGIVHVYNEDYPGVDEYAIDYCTDSKVLTEYYCLISVGASILDYSDVYTSESYTCPSNVCRDSACVPITCTDSDGGVNYETRGTITGLNGNQVVTETDYCLSAAGQYAASGSGLKEFYCNSDKKTIKSEFRFCNCIAGECVPSCSDSDGGVNYKKRGTITELKGNKVVTETDYCLNAAGQYAVSGSRLKEFYCPDQKTVRTIFRHCDCMAGEC